MAYDPLTTVQSLKAWLSQAGGVSTQTSPDDGEYTALIEVASEVIGRQLFRPNLGGVYPYAENYFMPRGFVNRPSGEFDIFLRHWPLVSLTSITVNNSLVTILTNATVASGNAGVYPIEGEPEDTRQLKFLGLYCDRYVPIQISYTAGYTQADIPLALQQATNQYASEIFRSPSWLGVKSKAIQGETITYDMGGAWGMSDRVKMMLKPFQNVVPFMYK